MKFIIIKGCIEIVSDYLGVSFVFIVFLFGMYNQIKDRNLDLHVMKKQSKKLRYGHKLSIWGFYGFLFFYLSHLLINFGIINNDIFLPGETSHIATYIALSFILFGKYLIHTVPNQTLKVLY